jgi:hypothetical protein
MKLDRRLIMTSSVKLFGGYQAERNAIIGAFGRRATVEEPATTSQKE